MSLPCVSHKRRVCRAFPTFTSLQTFFIFSTCRFSEACYNAGVATGRQRKHQWWVIHHIHESLSFMGKSELENHTQKVRFYFSLRSKFSWYNAVAYFSEYERLYCRIASQNTRHV